MLGDTFVVNDALDVILLVAFFFGLAFTSFSLLFGAFDLGSSGHGQLGHGDLGGGHDLQIPGGDSHDTGANIFNAGTILAFTTWFGGVTYLLRNSAGIPAVISLFGGIIGGIIGGWMILKILRWVKGQETFLDARREVLSGAMGRITSPIRDGGVGEIVYEMNGVRQVSAARAPQGIAIARGADVIVLRREKGVAFVEPWKALEAGDDWEERFGLEVASSGEKTAAG